MIDDAHSPSPGTRSVPSGRRAVVVLVGLAAALWLLVGHSYAVLGSSSMEPWGSPGDLLVHDTVPAAAVAVDDVVTVAGPSGEIITQRVVELADPVDGVVTVRLQGDASQLPDPVPVSLDGDVARVRLVVPVLGTVLRDWAWVLWTGLSLVLLGAVALWTQRRLPQPSPTLDLPQPDIEPTGDVTLVGRAAPSVSGVGPRIEALLVMCEQLVEDGLAAVVVADLIRVRTCEVLGLPSAERSGAVLALDDGARFYVVALADADSEALGVIPPTSARRRAATTAIDRWWAAVGAAVPADVRATIAPLLGPELTVAS